MVDIIEVQLELDMADMRSLLREYMESRNFDDALGDYQYELDHLQLKYGHPEGAMLIGRENKAAVGCVAFQRLSKEICEMKRLYVTPSARGKGVGKLLIQHILIKAKQVGYQKMRLDSHATMIKAIQLYQQVGFYEIGKYNQNPLKGVRFFEKSLS